MGIHINNKQSACLLNSASQRDIVMDSSFFRRVEKRDTEGTELQ